MRQTNFALALLAAAVLSACGGNDGDNVVTAPKPVFASQVTFGDSLSDVGTYAVGTVAALGGGRYTINGSTSATLHGKNWSELMAAQMNLAAPCPAVTGLDGLASSGFSVPVTNNLNCTGYAMGGARVTNPVGPGNKLTGSALGQLTYPLVTQVATHLARNGGSFKGNEIVYVMGGGNDVLALLGGLTAAATAAGNQAFITSLATQLAAGATVPSTAMPQIAAAMVAAAPQGTTAMVGAGVQAAVIAGNTAASSPAVYGPMVVKAQADGKAAGDAYGAANGPALVPQMAAAGLELANLIRTQIIGKGATHVVITNYPDIASSPSAKAQSASSQQLIAGMVSAFNIALRVGIDGLDDKFVFVDLFTSSQDQVANPGKYGITNSTKPACGPNNLGTTALVCTKANTLAGVDVSNYLFADDVHPAPYGQTLIAKAVAEALIARGWL